LSYGPSAYTGPGLQLVAPGGYGVGTIQFFTYSGQTVPSAQWSAEDLGNFTADHVLWTSQGGGSNAQLQRRLTIKGASGYVGIGITTPAHLLHVAGTIGAEEVIVSSTGADYVFDPSYRLKPLSEVKRYIDENHHLPEIPSASDVSAKGLGLGEMQSKLLAKIEELTLHMIRAEERSDRLAEENRDLRERLARVETGKTGQEK
jgi:hypothetical protein